MLYAFKKTSYVVVTIHGVQLLDMVVWTLVKKRKYPIFSSPNPLNEHA